MRRPSKGEEGTLATIAAEAEAAGGIEEARGATVAGKDGAEAGEECTAVEERGSS